MRNKQHFHTRVDFPASIDYGECLTRKGIKQIWLPEKWG